MAAGEEEMANVPKRRRRSEIVAGFMEKLLECCVE